ncbi:undecaprenyldiphospho-muramoylpentapeptide beta-N-acetylglucosaminyltransferase [Kiloniella sp. b19]|uniref:undecaprenyldiphospho-muramoylpentapeptide beta-N-acetylglucosaminyltransferase n=1 Tax=Kiloniella sp. GXU_MW_B19 TaxID=3141326 RepID=UPI0031D336AA
MTDTPSKHIVLTAGGTGGHMFPARALASELLARGHRVSLFTDSRGEGFGEGLSEVEVYRLPGSGVAGGNIIRKFISLTRIFKGTMQARKLLKTLQADAVVGFGGYAAVPASWAAGQVRIPLYLHEQNAVLGRANLLLANRAKAICTSFRKVSKIPASALERVIMTGNPVRANITAIGQQPYPETGEQSPVRLMVTGGSQGASVFNSLVPEALGKLPGTLRKRIHIAQQVRGDEQEIISARYQDAGISCDLRAFFDDMPDQLQNCHLMICRAGASTVTELAAAGIPAILVPYPYATDDHQTANANDVADAGGGWMMPQDSLNAEGLSGQLKALLENPETLQQAARSALSLAQPKAAARLADVVCGQIKPSRDGADPFQTQPQQTTEETAA